MSKQKLAAFAAAVMMTCGMVTAETSPVLSPFSNAAIETSAASTKTIEDFVKRMYEIVLGRSADSAGLKNWTSLLNSRKKTAADIVNGFFFSDEYKKKNKSDEAMIKDCYRAMLDRSPDSEGMATWKKQLGVGMTIQAVCKGFVGSSEFKKLCSSYGITPGSITLMNARDENYDRTYFVARLYENCLGRKPDTSGLENWCKRLKNGATGSTVAEGFVFSKEYLNALNKKKDYVFSDSYVTMLYKAFLGRTPSTNECTTWTEKMNDGNTLQYLFNGFLMSDEFKKQCEKANIKVGSKLKDPGDIDPAVYPSKMLEIINRERAKKGASPLKMHTAVTKVAVTNAERTRGISSAAVDINKMFADCGLNSKSSDFYYLSSMVQCVMFDKHRDGEKYTIATPQAAVDNLLANEYGRNRLLNPDMKYIGISTYIDDVGDSLRNIKRLKYQVVVAG